MKGCGQKDVGKLGGALFYFQSSPKSNLVSYWIGLGLDVGINMVGRVGVEPTAR